MPRQRKAQDRLEKVVSTSISATDYTRMDDIRRERDTTVAQVLRETAHGGLRLRVPVARAIHALGVLLEPSDDGDQLHTHLTPEERKLAALIGELRAGYEVLVLGLIYLEPIGTDYLDPDRPHVIRARTELLRRRREHLEECIREDLGLEPGLDDNELTEHLALHVGGAVAGVP